jgi:hypothetical protein
MTFTPVLWSRFRAVQSYFWIGLAVGLYLYLFVRVQWRIGDEGDMVNGALAIAEGKIPYRDFADLRGPGCFYWLGAFFKVFGATWKVARIHLLLTGTLSSVLVYWITQRVYRGPGALLPCAIVTVLSIPLWAAPHHHWDSNLFALGAACAFFLWQDRSKPGFLVAAGLLAGLTSTFIYQKGFLMLVAFLAMLLVSRYFFQVPLSVAKCLGLTLAGYATVGLGVLAWFYHIGALRDFISATITGPLGGYLDANKLPYGYMASNAAIAAWGLTLMKLPAPAAVLAVWVCSVPVILVAGLPILLVCLATYGGISRRLRSQLFTISIFSYLAIGSALWLSEIHRKDIMHLIYGSPILLVAVLLLWSRLNDSESRMRYLTAAIGIPLLVFATGKGVIASSANHQITTPRGVINLLQDDLALRFLLSDEVQQEKYVFVYPYYPAYYFLSHLKNPTRFGVLLYDPGCKPSFEEAIADLEAKRVKYILWDTLVEGENLKTWFPAYKHPPASELIMEQYFGAKYDQVGVLNGFRILRRKSAAAG